MKKNKGLIISILLLLTSVARAYDFTAVAPSGQTLYYLFNVTNVIVIYPGPGVGNYWSNGTKPVGDLVIPDSVVYEGKTYAVGHIYSYAFIDCSGLTSVTIPNTVKTIGYFAFENCSGITSLTIGNSVTRIYTAAFHNCSALTSLTIPNSVTSIGGSIFRGCSALTSVTIGNSLTSVSNYAFFGCSSLLSVTIPNSVKDIANYAFENCSALTSVTIGDSVTSIGNKAFYGCSSLSSVTIPNSVTSIYEKAFQNCSALTSVTIGTSVRSIGNFVFGGCGNVDTLYFNARNMNTSPDWYDSSPYYDSYGFRPMRFSVLILGDSVESIPAGAFYRQNVLASVAIPDSVTSIGSGAFGNCSGLASVTLGASVTSIGQGAFNNCTNLLHLISQAVYPPTCSGSEVFQNIPSQCKLTVPCGSWIYYEETAPWNTQFPIHEEDCIAQYTVTVVSADPTMGEVSGGGTVLDGDILTIRAMAYKGYRFQHWDDGNTDAVRDIEVHGDITYTAYFEEDIPEGIEDASTAGFTIAVQGHRIVVEGIGDQKIRVFDITGRQIGSVEGNTATVPASGVYFVKVGDHPARKVVVIR